MLPRGPSRLPELLRIASPCMAVALHAVEAFEPVVTVVMSYDGRDDAVAVVANPSRRGTLSVCA